MRIYVNEWSQELTEIYNLQIEQNQGKVLTASTSIEMRYSYL